MSEEAATSAALLERGYSGAKTASILRRKYESSMLID
jgi:hypothetical protein